MSNATESKSDTTVISAHPLWCVEYDKAHPVEHDYHESEPLHAELQCYEVGFSLAVERERSTECDPNETTAHLIARFRDRGCGNAMEITLTEAEAEAMIGLLTKQLASLRRYNAWRGQGDNT